jgi:hypothetical protein
MKRLLALCLATGCGISSTDVTNQPQAPLGTPGEPSTPDDPANPGMPMSFKTGPYELVTRVEITAEAVLPSQPSWSWPRSASCRSIRRTR